MCRWGDTDTCAYRLCTRFTLSFRARTLSVFYCYNRDLSPVSPSLCTLESRDCRARGGINKARGDRIIGHASSRLNRKKGSVVGSRVVIQFR